MSTPRQPIEWNRLLVEGVVIVASILLAFAIDAWWDKRQELQDEERQLLSIVAELDSNAERIREKLDTLAVAEDATRRFLSWMGPEPLPVDQGELKDAFSKMYSIGSFALLRGASESYLSGARFETANHERVRKSIAAWDAAGDELEKQYSWLREAHANLGEYLSDAVPMHYFDASHPLLQGIQGSRFPFDRTVLLADPKIESRISLYLIRIRFVEAQATELIENQAQLMRLVQSAADK